MGRAIVQELMVFMSLNGYLNGASYDSPCPFQCPNADSDRARARVNTMITKTITTTSRDRMTQNEPNRHNRHDTNENQLLILEIRLVGRIARAVVFFSLALSQPFRRIFDMGNIGDVMFSLKLFQSILYAYHSRDGN